jgi:hypothetical protein
MFGEGSRWFRTSCVCGQGCAPAWALLAGYAEPAGLVFHERGLAWGVHLVRSGVMQSGVSFANAVAIVEQAATNALDATSAAPKL